MFVVMGSTGPCRVCGCRDAIDAGCEVIAIARDEANARKLRDRGAQVERRTPANPTSLRNVLRKGRRAFLLNPPAPVSTDTDEVEHRSRRGAGEGRPGVRVRGASRQKDRRSQRAA